MFDILKVWTPSKFVSYLFLSCLVFSFSFNQIHGFHINVVHSKSTIITTANRRTSSFHSNRTPLFSRSPDDIREKNKNQAQSTNPSISNISTLYQSSSNSNTPEIPGPEPRKFMIRSDKYLDIISASVPLVARLGSGALTAGWSVRIGKNEQYNVDAPPIKKEDQTYSFARFLNLEIQENCANFKARPRKPLIIYEFQGCPFCAKVREAVTILDLDVLFKPCPRDGPTYRPYVLSQGGKAQFPYLVDPNTKKEMYESDDIIRHLYETYGPVEKDNNNRKTTTTVATTTSTSISDEQEATRTTTTKQRRIKPRVKVYPTPGFSTILTTGLGLVPRAGRGSKYDQDSNTYQYKQGTMEPIEFWAYEASPFCRIVKEVLNELEIPHLQRSCARGSPKRDVLLRKVGHFQVPYIEDPNTGVKMFESAEIIDYLRKEYTGVVPKSRR